VGLADEVAQEPQQEGYGQTCQEQPDDLLNVEHGIAPFATSRTLQRKSWDMIHPESDPQS
jgi:hypothetical protein